MVRLFSKNETNFDHNETVLQPLSCVVTEEANSRYELEMEIDIKIEIEEGTIIKAPTPNGEQLFRVYKIVKNMKTKYIYALHIFYDLAKDFIIDCRPTNSNCYSALNNVLLNTVMSHRFTGTSDILDTNTAYYIRKNPIEAILGAENSIIKKWRGNLIRDNFNIDIKRSGIDRGYEILMGKNLLGIEEDIDDTNVITRLYPTFVLGDNDTVYSIPERFIDSPLINNYPTPIIREFRVELTDEEKSFSMDTIYDIIRNRCSEMFRLNNVDKVAINYKISFIQLSKTKEYEHLKILERLELYDRITCKVQKLGIDVQASVIKYKYDSLKERYIEIELGDYRASNKYQTPDLVSQLTNKIEANETAREYATNLITGNKGGYIKLRQYPNGKPYEFLIMDTEDIGTAKNVFRLNNSGLGFSTNGYNGAFNTAMTLDGHIVADYIDTGVLKSILLESNNYVANSKGMQINLADGTIDSKNFKLDTFGNGKFSGEIYGGSININDKFKVDINGNLIATSGEFSGTITGSTINGGTITGANISGGTISTFDTIYGTVTMTNGYIHANNGDSNSIFQGGLISTDGLIQGYNINATNKLIANSITTSLINDHEPITTNNINTYAAKIDHNHNGLYSPISHNHSGVYSPVVHMHTSEEVASIPTAYGNIRMAGFLNAASVSWCDETFQTKSSSDFRLKKNIRSLDELPIELYMELKPKLFEYKCDRYNKGSVIGLLAQQVESAFERYGLNPYDYNLIEIVNTKTYTNEGIYILDGKIHRINYNNFIAWSIYVMQKIYQLVSVK